MKWSDYVYKITIAPKMRALQRLLPDAKIHPCGSRYVCDPAVMNTDIDFLIYNKTGCSAVLAVAGYKRSSDEMKYADEKQFKTYRKGWVNLIVTQSLTFATGFHTATYICKRWNVLNKDKRILVHAAFRENEYYPDSCKAIGLDVEILELLAAFNGPHGHTLHMAYRAQHGLERAFT